MTMTSGINQLIGDLSKMYSIDCMHCETCECTKCGAVAVIQKLDEDNTKLRDLLKRSLPYVESADIDVVNRNGTSTDPAKLADEIKQAIGPLPGGESQ